MEPRVYYTASIKVLLSGDRNVPITTKGYSEVEGELNAYLWVSKKFPSHQRELLDELALLKIYNVTKEARLTGADFKIRFILSVFSASPITTVYLEERTLKLLSALGATVLVDHYNSNT